MHQEKIRKLRELIQWVRETTGKTANLTVDFWAFSCHAADHETIEYTFYVEGGFTKKFQDIDYLLKVIPDIKQYCLLQKELAA